MRWVGWLGVLAGCGGRAAGDDSDAGPPCELVAVFADADRDGFGDPTRPHEVCEPGGAWVIDGSDCDDADALVNPDVGESCDGVDQDCDGLVDDDAIDGTDYFFDFDADGYGGDPAGSSCSPIDGASYRDGDCDDGDPLVRPYQLEDWYDGRDTNCDGVVEQPGAVEVITVPEPPYAEWQRVPETFAARVVTAGTGVGEPVTVSVESPEPTFVFLVSSSPVDWEVVETYPGAVQAVYYDSGTCCSSVVAPRDLRADDRDLPYAVTLTASEMEDLRGRVEELSGERPHSIHTVQGEVAAVRLLPTTEAPVHPGWPECDPFVEVPFAADRDDSALGSACAAERAESAWCMGFANSGQLRIVGLDSGSECDTGVSHGGWRSPWSMAWTGSDLYLCGDDDMLTRVPLDGSAPDHAFEWCDGVMADGARLYTMGSISSAFDTSVWESWGRAQCSVPDYELDYGWRAYSWSAADGVAYTSRSDETIRVYDLGTGDELFPIVLDAPAGRDGHAMLDGRMMVLGTNEIRAHDPESGVTLETWPLTESLYGLACAAP
jgi:hypothetical protein